MKTQRYSEIAERRPARLRVPLRLTSPSADAWVDETLAELATRSGALNEGKATSYLVRRIDPAMMARSFGSLRGLLDAIDPGTLRDHVALAVVVITLPARLPLNPARARYVDRVRRELAARGWKPADLARALDDLV